MRVTSFLFIAVLCAASYAPAQTSYGFIVRKKLPDDLRSALETRLSQFIGAQAEGREEEVGDFLGRCRLGCSPGRFYRSYTESYKQCLVNRIQELRMVSFEFSPEDLWIRRAGDQVMPIGGLVDRFTAEQAEWHVKGLGRFQTSSESWMEQTELIAYRDQGQWYFVPPQQRMQDKWEKGHYTEADFRRDRKDEIEVSNPALAPIEITDVHVYMDRRYPSDRNIKFTLRNKTSKKVVALSVRIGDAAGSTEMSGPYELGPKRHISFEKTEVPAYFDFCDGRFKNGMVVDWVSFVDGTTWALKEPASSESTKQ